MSDIYLSDYACQPQPGLERHSPDQLSAREQALCDALTVLDDLLHRSPYSAAALAALLDREGKAKLERAATILAEVRA